jgi:raffinose/stachyose/melibiose transport system permease protein
MELRDLSLFHKVVIWSVIISVTIITVFPFLYLLSLSLSEFSDTFKIICWPLHFKLDNYVEVFQTIGIVHFYRNSIIVALTTVLVNLLLGAPAAYVFARYSNRGTEILYYIFLLGLMIPQQSIVIPLFNNLKLLHLLNNYLTLGLVYPSIGLAFTIFVLRSFFKSFSQEILDAAVIDGSGPYRVFWQIVIPLSRPVLSSVALFQLIWAWDEFLLAFTFINDEKMMTLPAGLSRLQGEYFTNYPVLGAALVLSCIPIIIFYLAAQQQFISGLTAGALKE